MSIQIRMLMGGGMIMDRDNAVSGGLELGSVLAVVISWSLNHSILWAILHGIFSWFYVIYYAIFL